MNALKNTMKLALCGVIAALSAVLLFLTGVIPVATLALPALAGCLLIPVVAEIGTGWGFGAYAVCAVLAFLLAPDREAALFYVLFFGLYPVLLGPLSRVEKPALALVLKFLLFNAALLAETLLSVYVLGIPLESVSFLGPLTLPVLWVLANGVFYFYERALRGLVALYIQRFHPAVRRLLAGGR